MAYARFGAEGSDVYVYEDVTGYFRCARCRLNGDEWRTNHRSQMIVHLEDHRRAGHIVPDRATNQLAEEIVSLGDSI